MTLQAQFLTRPNQNTAKNVFFNFILETIKDTLIGTPRLKDICNYLGIILTQSIFYLKSVLTELTSNLNLSRKGIVLNINCEVHFWPHILYRKDFIAIHLHQLTSTCGDIFDPEKTRRVGCRPWTPLYCSWDDGSLFYRFIFVCEAITKIKSSMAHICRLVIEQICNSIN